MTFDVRDPAFHDLIPEGAVVEQIAGGLTFTEGPVWYDGGLLFSDIPNKRIVRWRQLKEGPELTTFTTGQQNGLTLDRQGRLLAAEHDGRRVVRIGPTGTRTVVAETYQGKRLNSPNDIVVRVDGSIYFTDPPYALAGRDQRAPGWWSQMIPGKELAVNGVYRLTADGALALLTDDMALPNGLAFSPDERTLYVDDSERRHVKAFEVQDDGSLGGSRIAFELDGADPGVPDGMKVDAAGNIYCTGPGGVWVARPDGRVLGRILTPEVAANLAWGDDWRTLFITARTGVYRVRTNAEGVRVP